MSATTANVEKKELCIAMNKILTHKTTRVWNDAEYPSMLYKYGCLFVARIDREAKLWLKTLPYAIVQAWFEVPLSYHTTGDTWRDADGLLGWCRTLPVSYKGFLDGVMEMAGSFPPPRQYMIGY